VHRVNQETSVPRPARRVLAASLLARAPQGMAPLAVILLVQERTSSLSAAGLASGAWGLGVAVGQPLWARPAARGRAALVVGAVALLQAAVLALLATVPWSAAAVGIALAGLAGLLGAPITSVARTLWPELVQRPKQLDRLFTLDATSQEVIWIAGPALVGALLAVSGVNAAVVGTAVAGGAGGAWFARTVDPLWQPHPVPAGRADFARQLVAPWLALAMTGTGLGLTEVAVPAAAILDGRRDAAGWLLAVWSVGSLVGGLLAARFPSAHDPARRVPSYLALLAVGGGLTAAVWSSGLGWLAVALFVTGLGLAPTLAAVYGVVSRSVPAARRTQAYAIGTTVILTGLAAGSAVGGVLSEQTPTKAFLAAAVSSALAALGWWTWAQRTRSTRPSSHTGSPAS
jgi:MFS family permease